MQNRCELCGNIATLTDRTVKNNGSVEYHFCESCFKSIQKSGLTAFDIVQEAHARKGKVCKSCGCVAKEFQDTFCFGCADCYRDMRDLAESAILATQGVLFHIGKKPRNIAYSLAGENPRSTQNFEASEKPRSTQNFQTREKSRNTQFAKNRGSDE